MADEALIAHILRRTTFGPRPGQVEALASLGAAGVIEQVIAGSPLAPEEPQLGTGDDYTVLRQWWLRVLGSLEAGLHEKMLWFWHGHLTSSLDKCQPALMLIQHRVLRAHALGNFRQLLQEITTDGAMLEWLDGTDSHADAPNENYARELLELFALGVGNYTETDVRNGAIALSGWRIDYENALAVWFDEEAGPRQPVEFLGRTVASAAEVIDAVCEHPACAAHIAGKLHRFFVGSEPDDGRRGELAAVFRDSGYEIRPLVEAILRHPSFLETRLNRPRTGIEWHFAAQSVLDIEMEEWRLYDLGHVPFAPPNVAGWPGDDRWVSAGAIFVKASAALDFTGDTPTFATDDPVAEALAKAGLWEVSDETRSALGDAAAGVEGLRETSSLLHALVLTCPEFNLA